MRYTVSFLRPASHVFDLRCHIPDLSAGRHVLSLPVWTPGSYQIQDYARNLFGLEASAHGRPLAVDQVAKNRWQFELGEPATVDIRYHVFAYELNVRASHLDATHAYWNGAQLFLLVDDRPEAPVEVEIEAPPGWKVATGLERVADAPHRFWAPSYDVLIDSPVEVGTHRTVRFEVEGKPHTVAVWGTGNEDLARLTQDIQRIVATQARLMGGLPYAAYTFILHLTDRNRGGLEHLNSTTINVERFQFRPPKQYRKVLKLIAHEFFHLWNVKRIHPEALGPFDYDRENYTHLLWAMEGVTDYYAGLTLLWAGLDTPLRYLEGLGERIQAYEKTPGRFQQSLSQASLEAWTKFYKPSPDSPNRTISYYLKGDLVGTCLDLEIRRRTQGQRGLEDVLHRLWDRYGRHQVGFPESVYQETAEEVVGSSLQDFFDRYVDGVDPLPIDEYLGWAGLVVERGWRPLPDAEEGDAAGPAGSPPVPARAWLGVEWDPEARAPVVRVSLVGGPAAELLYPEDEVVALNRVRVRTRDQLMTRLERDFQPGDTVTVTVFRRDELVEVPVVLGPAPYTKVVVRPRADASAAERALFEAWLKVPWPQTQPAEGK
ncbi:MAG: PDZ domain-containing protein [Firmicutes bacterium]|nr:M61 family metallopeptidase [Alicyclobacillaceae bacterium]MCL6498054.1 PDZ domain-containing protein [Bacillota bacterium]